MNNRVDDYQLKQIEFYDSTAQYGGYFDRITVILEYNLLVEMLKTCPHTEDYKTLLSLLKAVKKAGNLEKQLEKEIPFYNETDKAEPWTAEAGWKDGKVGFLVHDSQGKCEKLSLWIDYELLLDLVFSYGDKAIIDELVNSSLTDDLRKKVLDKLKSL